MIKTFINSFKVSFAENANTLILFMERIPFINSTIPEDLYKRTQAKLAIGIAAKILGILFGLFRKAFYLMLMIVLPSYYITGDAAKLQPLFIHIFFFMSVVLGAFLKTEFFEINIKPAYTMVMLMRADAREYYLGSILYKRIADFLSFTLLVAVAGIMIGFSPLTAIVIAAELVTFRLFAEWLNLFLYDKTGSLIVKNNTFIFIITLVTFVPAYGLPLLGFTINFESILSNVFVITIFLGIGCAAFYGIWNYRRFTVLAKSILIKDRIFNMDFFKTEMNFGNVKLDKEKMSKEALNTKIYDHKQGYAYLNSIFFLRFQRILITPVKIRVFLIGIVFLAGICAAVLIPETNAEWVQTLQSSTPIFAFVMYSISTGERICKAMFFNCDVKLLRYSYYRDKNAILTNFTLRLKRVVFLNAIPAAALCLAIAGYVAASGYSIELAGLIPLFLCILCLSGFFSIHHLFMYYVIQPYTADLTVKSPLFKVVHMLGFPLSFLCLQIKTSSLNFTFGVLAITVLYMAIALFVTYRIAPSTFRLK